MVIGYPLSFIFRFSFKSPIIPISHHAFLFLFIILFWVLVDGGVLCFLFFFLFVLFLFWQRKPSLSSPPVSPTSKTIHRQMSAPVLSPTGSSCPAPQSLPLPPPRSRKRSDVPPSLSLKVKKTTTSKILFCNCFFSFFSISWLIESLRFSFID